MPQLYYFGEANAPELTQGESQVLNELLFQFFDESQPTSLAELWEYAADLKAVALATIELGDPITHAVITRRVDTLRTIRAECLKRAHSKPFNC